MMRLWCLSTLLALQLGRQVMAQTDVIVCQNLYNDQHAKLASIKDEKEKRDIDCEAQKVQFDCLNRVHQNVAADQKLKELAPCVELKVKEAEKGLKQNCDACKRSPWQLMTFAAFVLTMLMGYVVTPS